MDMIRVTFDKGSNRRATVASEETELIMYCGVCNTRVRPVLRMIGADIHAINADELYSYCPFCDELVIGAYEDIVENQPEEIGKDENEI